MNYEERERQICRECRANVKCSYIPRKLEYKCQNLSDTMYGWELGYKDAVNKAYKWLLEQMFELNEFEEIYVANGDASSIEEFLDNFNKAMEKQE